MSSSSAAIGRRGLMLVLSSPSGAGKSTIARRLLADDRDLEMSVSVTTRPKRPTEEDGVHYHFMDQPRFEAMRDAGDLLEHATVFGNSYGTPRRPVEERLGAGGDVLFDIDWQGTQQIAARMPDDLVSVFVLPPSTDELERRLRARAEDPEDVVAARMAKAADEISHWAEYDYIVVNIDVDQAVADVHAILRAERLGRRRRTGLVEFVAELQGR